MLSAIQTLAIVGLGSNESSLYSYRGDEMLSVNDLIDINYIPAESDISLRLLIDFYESYLCKRIFIFTLKGGRVIKLFFRDATEIFHISGIDHVYKGIPMDGSRFLQDVKAGKITLDTVRNVNVAAYKDYEIRIRSMACIDTIIKNCEYLWYPSGKIPDSEIEVKYLLLKGLDNNNLHLGIDTYKENRPYFVRTLLITEGNNIGKFIGKADERLKVSKLEIRDKETDLILNCVEREKAEQTALEEVKSYAHAWMDTELPTLLLQYLNHNTVDKEVPVGCVRSSDKKAWCQACRKYIEYNKADIKSKVEKLDSYWAGKIVGEAIRKYDKDEMKVDLANYINEYISNSLLRDT